MEKIKDLSQIYCSGEVTGFLFNKLIRLMMLNEILNSNFPLLKQKGVNNTYKANKTTTAEYFQKLCVFTNFRILNGNNQWCVKAAKQLLIVQTR